MKYLAYLLLLVSASALAGSNTETYAANVDGAGTYLRWDRYIPAFGGPTWPVAVVVHGGGYKAGGRGPFYVAQDLANAGFITFAIDYRLAPPASSMPQQVDPPSDGRPPEQTTDVQTAFHTARLDSQSNGKLVAVGFSSGGAHSTWWLLSGIANDTRPDAVVSCSSPFDLDNVDMLANPSDLSDVQNYINHLLVEGAPFHAAAQAASAYDLTLPAGTPVPILMFNSTAETIPTSVFNNMVTKITAGGGTVESHLRTGTEHASSYWYLSYGGSFPTVKDASIDFLYRALGATPPPVSGTANIQAKRK